MYSFYRAGAAFLPSLKPNWIITLYLCNLLFASSDAFYLPGAAPHNFVRGEQVPVMVNALTPMLSGSDDAKLVRLFQSYSVNYS